MGFKEKVMNYINSDRRRSIEIDLPNGEREKIFFMPMTLGDWDKISLIAQGSNSALQAWTVIEKAENEDGSKVFSAADKPFLEMLDASVLMRITNEILKIEPNAEVKKTLEPMPSG